MPTYENPNCRTYTLKNLPLKKKDVDIRTTIQHQKNLEPLDCGYQEEASIWFDIKIADRGRLIWMISYA